MPVAVAEAVVRKKNIMDATIPTLRKMSYNGIRKINLQNQSAYEKAWTTFFKEHGGA